MDSIRFADFIKEQSTLIDSIKDEAWTLHESVGQTYDHTHPYGLHLSMVADAAIRYGHEVTVCEEDIVPMLFGAYFHDSIEDARLTYNDVTRAAGRLMTPGQAFTAAEIVYALTNDKGRTRAERAGEHYYAGIRRTPYAPFVKLCDRFANMSYSFLHANEANLHMREVYRAEWTHFISAITASDTDIRLSLPSALTARIEELMR